MELLVSTCLNWYGGFHNPFPENSLTKMLLKFVLANRATILCPLNLSMSRSRTKERDISRLFFGVARNNNHIK